MLMQDAVQNPDSTNLNLSQDAFGNLRYPDGNSNNWNRESASLPSEAGSSDESKVPCQELVSPTRSTWKQICTDDFTSITLFVYAPCVKGATVSLNEVENGMY